MAIVHRNHFQHPAQDGRPLLRQGGELARTSRGARGLARRLQRSETLAYRERKDGRRSPEEVLGWLTGMRYRDEDLERAFFSTRFTRKLDSLGYARFRHWRLYAEEALAGREAALWLESETLTMEYAGEALSRYEVRHSPGSAELRRVGKATLLETSIVVRQPKLFDLAETLCEEGWLKSVRLAKYAPRRLERPNSSSRCCSHTRRPFSNLTVEILCQR